MSPLSDRQMDIKIQTTHSLKLIQPINAPPTRNIGLKTPAGGKRIVLAAPPPGSLMLPRPVRPEPYLAATGSAAAAAGGAPAPPPVIEAEPHVSATPVHAPQGNQDEAKASTPSEVAAASPALGQPAERRSLQQLRSASLLQLTKSGSMDQSAPSQRRSVAGSTASGFTDVSQGQVPKQPPRGSAASSIEANIAVAKKRGSTIEEARGSPASYAEKSGSFVETSPMRGSVSSEMETVRASKPPSGSIDAFEIPPPPPIYGTATPFSVGLDLPKPRPYSDAGPPPPSSFPKSDRPMSAAVAHRKSGKIPSVRWAEDLVVETRAKTMYTYSDSEIRWRRRKDFLLTCVGRGPQPPP